MDDKTLLDMRKEEQVIQDPFASLDPRMRVAEILDEGLAALQPDLAPDVRRQRITAIAEQVGLRREALQRWPHEFSGGQRQRITIARALAVQPNSSSATSRPRRWTSACRRRS